MDEFDQLCEQLRLARYRAEAAGSKLRQSTERLRRAEAARRQFETGMDASQAGQQVELARLQSEVEELQAKVEELREALMAANEDVRVALIEVHNHTDPVNHFYHLDPSSPLCLFPVRLETRFKKVPRVAENGEEGEPVDELWVRVYPDACLVDTFEETLTEAELRNGRRFWLEFWRSGGNRAENLSAWRALCASHGSGRAEWISRRLRPVSPGNPPQKTSNRDVILVIAGEPAMSVQMRLALEKFWKAVWLADRKLDQEDAAKQALIGSVGAGVATGLMDRFRPHNLAETPPPGVTKAEARLSVAWVKFPSDVETKQRGWNRPPRVDLLPDRFVLVTSNGGVRDPAIVGNPIHSPLEVGLDPSALPEEQMQRDADGNLVVPETMKWMTDFDQAVEWGMGFRVPLTSEQAARGFDRLIVLGLRMQSSADEGGQLVENLFQHHRHGRSGIAIVPQGTPTNNTEGRSAGHSRIDDPEESFARLFGSGTAAEASPDPFAKSDGQWLAELLGLGPESAEAFAKGSTRDQAEARAMNRVLFPATVRYFASTLMFPAFQDETIDRIEWYFTNFVTGRGAVPSLRIGAQPYGILPVTALEKRNWLEHPALANHRDFLTILSDLLKRAGEEWARLAEDVTALAQPRPDAHTTLLGILAGQPSSVEYAARLIESSTLMFNIPDPVNAADFFLFSEKQKQALQAFLVETFGYTEPPPDLSEQFPFADHFDLQGPLVDEQPLSESEALQPVGGVANYLQWLREIAAHDLDELRLERSFGDGGPPRALLYLMVRQSLMLGYHGAAYRLFKSAHLLSDRDLAELRREPSMVHVKRGERSNSRWWPLYSSQPDISPSGGRLLWRYIAELLEREDPGPEALPLREQLASLESLVDLPTARLERLFAEHLDCCSYRLDAWQLGMCHLQLSLMRYESIEGSFEYRHSGLTVGGYAWLENVRPERVVEVMELEPDLAEIFDGPTPVLRDPTNAGFVHAPSLNHAVTAAILRNGYISNPPPGDQQALAVNLSSNRVRLAMSFLEGMRNGQSLGALLGYQLERGLHDAYQLGQCDALIYDLRSVFPLRAGNLRSTAVSEAEKQAVEAAGGKAIEALEARNVVDGLKLVEHIRGLPDIAYPFGLSPPLPALTPATAELAAALENEVRRLIDIHDALGDLALAEGVHQATQGNFDRASAMLSTMTTGHYPPQPAVVQTPLKGSVLTHRVGLQLDPSVTEVDERQPPRRLAEPALNSWLREHLPMERVACTIRWTRPAHTDGSLGEGTEPQEVTVATKVVQLSELAIEPLDWLAMVPLEAAGQLTELDDRVLREVFREGDPHPGLDWKIDYGAAPARFLTVAAVAPLTRAFRTMIQKSRSLKPVDLTRQENDAASLSFTPSDVERVERVRAALERSRASLDRVLGDIAALLSDEAANHDVIISTIDARLRSTLETLEETSRFGLTQSGWGFLFRGRLEFQKFVQGTISQRTAQLRTNLDAHKQALTAYSALAASAPDEARIRELRRAEAAVTSKLMDQPATMAAFQGAVEELGRNCERQLAAWDRLLAAPPRDMAAMRDAVVSNVPSPDDHAEPIDLDAIDQRLIDLLRQIRAALESVNQEVVRRLESAKQQLTSVPAHQGDQPGMNPSAASREGQRTALINGARALLGEDFPFIPRFRIASEFGGQWRNALQAAQDGSLFTHLRDRLGIEFPVEEWLQGVARVRPQLSALERINLHCEAFGLREPALTPAQFPFVSDDPWLALEYPSTFRSSGDRLLYTAAYAAPFDSAAEQAGLLIDEWTEVIPVVDTGRARGEGENSDDIPDRPTQETGLSFHFDRPNNEAPQTMLLVLPTTWDNDAGRWVWSWDDILDALDSTLALAKQRGVEPEQLQRNRLAQILPALLVPQTARDISIGALLARNNGVDR